MQAPPDLSQQELLRQKSHAWMAHTQPIATVAAPADRRRRRPWWGEIWRWTLVIALFAFMAVGLLSASLLAAIYWQARQDQSRPVDAIVVLGAAQYNGRPSPVLQARLDEAAKAYAEGLAPVVIVTGGKQPGDQFTEAEASRDYLVDHGVPESAILLETGSHTTWQSMQGSAELLDDIGAQSVLIVSDGFHLFRAKLMARDLGFSPAGRPASDSPIQASSGRELDYVLREAAGVLGFLWQRRT